MHTILEEMQQDIAEIKRDIKIRPADEYTDVHGIAEITGLSKHTIYKYCEHKKIPFFRIGGVLRFKRSEIIEWMQSKRGA